MNNKQNERLKYAAVILLICIIVAGAIFLFLVFRNRVGKLCPEGVQQESTEMMAEEIYEEYDEDFYEEKNQEMNLKGFSVGGSEKSSKKDKKAREENTGDYLCSYSSERILTEEDIEELEKEDYGDLPEDKTLIRMIINEMYARYGFEFQNEQIRDYFNQRDWYKNMTERESDMNLIYKNMSDVEKANVEFLTALEEEE